MDIDCPEGQEILEVFAEAFFENPGIRKVYHNYGFDRHVLENMTVRDKATGQPRNIRMAGFVGDTMHMARIYDSSRMVSRRLDLPAMALFRRRPSPRGPNTFSKFSKSYPCRECRAMRWTR